MSSHCGPMTSQSLSTAHYILILKDMVSACWTVLNYYLTNPGSHMIVLQHCHFQYERLPQLMKGGHFNNCCTQVWDLAYDVAMEMLRNSAIKSW